jgi:hypothetical protein
MAQDQGGFVDAVPFHDIAAANTAGFNPYQDLSRTDFRTWHFFDPDIPVVIVQGYTHHDSSVPFHRVSEI